MIPISEAGDIENLIKKLEESSKEKDESIEIDYF